MRSRLHAETEETHRVAPVRSQPAERAASPTTAFDTLVSQVGNGAVARLVDERVVRRHSLEDALDEDEEGVIQRTMAAPVGVLQRDDDDVEWSTNPLFKGGSTGTDNPLYDPTAPRPRAPYADPIREKFTQVYETGDKTAAVNVLKKAYKLDTKDYALTVEVRPKASTHASTGGGWNQDGSAKSPIYVKVNTPYLDKAVDDDARYNKFLHTLSHEYQHVKQRSQKGWQTTGNDSARGEREFQAYSFEVLDARKDKGVPDLPAAEKLSTISKARKYYGTMDAKLQKKYKKRMARLEKIAAKGG